MSFAILKILYMLILPAAIMTLLCIKNWVEKKNTQHTQQGKIALIPTKCQLVNLSED